MSLSNLSSAQLAHLIGLVREKELLQTKLDRVDAALQALEGGKSAQKKSAAASGVVRGFRGQNQRGKVRKSRRGKRLKAPLLKALSAAGSSGITVKELAGES